jgi:tetratricopeptide (TPR) repeat protein/HEAT repeat protein
MLRRSLALAAALLVAAVAPRPAPAQDDDWSVKQNPFDPRIVNGYKALLEKNPNDAAALKKLVNLYGKYSTLDKLVAEYEAAAKKSPKSWVYPMILGHIWRARGDVPKALAHYEKAAELAPAEPTTHTARAELYRQSNRPDDAAAAYEKALPLAKDKKDKKAILRSLADLALDKKDIAKARGYYKQYLDLDPKDITARLDLADALSRHDHHQEALAEYQAAEKQLGTDPARRVEVLARIGKELEALGKPDEAVAVYRQAMDLTQKGHYLRKELTERIIDIYRKKQDLRGLIAYYDKAWPAKSRGHFEWDIMARLYEEAGEQDKALDAYRRAVKAAPYELDTQRRLIALLERAGKEDEAIAQYEAVIRVAPGEPRFQLELAERYHRRGEPKKALELAKKIGQRFPDDPGVHAALADMYSRWGQDALALAEYEKLTRIEPEDESHLVDLGEQHFQKGDKAKAVEVWKKIAAAKTPEAYARLAEVYAEHDMGVEAIDMYQKAIALKPKEPAFWRGLAGVYERQRQDDRAIEAWTKVMDLTKDQAAQKQLRREARSRIIAIYARKQPNPLANKAREWDKKFQQNPPDIEAGYFAAEAYTKLGQYDNAERILKRLLNIDANDLDAMQALVGVYKSLHKYREAIDLLKVLAEKSPGREREYYTQISELELALYNDDEAVAYAQKALEKSPSDPDAQERLAEIYERKGDPKAAIDAYKRAISLAPRKWGTYFSLARLYVQQGMLADASKLYRQVIRGASEEDVVRRAARKAIDLEEVMGSLGDLEREIAPLVFTYGQKPFYRRILVDIYERYVPWLAARARRGDAAAKKELASVSEHGLRPLLDALADGTDPQQQRVAVQVLGYLGNKNAAGPLVKLALSAPPPEKPGAGRVTGVADDTLGVDLRVEALVAAGRLGDGRIVPELVKLLASGEKRLREAAVWALGRTGDAKAVAPLTGALADGQTSVQALACLGLGRIGDKKGLTAAAAHMRKPGVSADVRAACAYALGVSPSPAFIDDLVAVVQEGNEDVQRKAAWALGRIGDKRALGALLRAYWQKRDSVRQAVVWALARVWQGGTDASPLPEDDVVIEKGKLDYRRLLRGLAADVPDLPLDPAMIAGRERELGEGLVAALGRHRDIVVRVLRDLDARPDGLALGRLTDGLDAADARAQKSTRAVLDALGPSLVPALEPLTQHKDVEVRRLALSVLAKTRAPQAVARLEAALGDPEPRVRAAAMTAVATWVRLTGTKSAEATRLGKALGKRLATGEWQERRDAALASASLGEAADVGALTAALGDDSGFVREAAAQALGRVASSSDAKVVDALLALTNDEAPEVRLAAVAALKTLGVARSGKVATRLGELAKSDPDERVRAAAAGK